MAISFIESYKQRALWSKLHKTCHSPIAQLSIFMPIFGYIILLNDEFRKYSDIAPEYKLIVGDGSWRIECLYYGTFLLGIAATVFNIRASSFSRYSTAFEFFNVSREYLTSLHGKQSLFIALNRRDDRHAPESKYISEIPNHIRTLLDYNKPERATMDDVVAMAASVWILENQTFPKSRIFCLVCSDFAVLFILAPAAATFLGVLNYSFSSLL